MTPTPSPTVLSSIPINLMTYFITKGLDISIADCTNDNKMQTIIFAIILFYFYFLNKLKFQLPLNVVNSVLSKGCFEISL